MREPSKGRRLFATRSLDLRPYDMDGPVQPEMSYARLSHEADSERGSYLVTGCLLLGLDWGPPCRR